jgi:hypothetical protein
MRKLFVITVLALAVGLGGCAKTLPSLDLTSSVTLNTMQSIEASYGIALSGERAYKALPLCRTGTVATVTEPCAQRSLVVRLQAADRKALSAIQQANAFIKKYPTVDATNVISAAATAVGALKNLLSSNGVQ